MAVAWTLSAVGLLLCCALADEEEVPMDTEILRGSGVVEAETGASAESAVDPKAEIGAIDESAVDPEAHDAEKTEAISEDSSSKPAGTGAESTNFYQLQDIEASAIGQLQGDRTFIEDDPRPPTKKEFGSSKRGRKTPGASEGDDEFLDDSDIDVDVEANTDAAKMEAYSEDRSLKPAGIGAALTDVNQLQDMNEPVTSVLESDSQLIEDVPPPQTKKKFGSIKQGRQTNKRAGARAAASEGDDKFLDDVDVTLYVDGQGEHEKKEHPVYVTKKKSRVGFASDEDPILTDEELGVLFRSIDEDESGGMSVSELLKFESHLQQEVAEKEVEQNLRDLDSEGNGALSLLDIIGHYDPDDSNLSWKHFEEVKFNAADENGDGVLNKTELPSFFFVETNRKVMDAIATYTLNEADVNQDGRLDLEEIRTNPRLREMHNRHSANDAEVINQSDIDRHDKNHDGVLDLNELKAWQTEKMHRKQGVQNIVDIADANHDGRVTLEELGAAQEELNEKGHLQVLLDWVALSTKRMNAHGDL
eukprot:gnl/MRDRNA2_/MRDRNA2_31568_c0_seq1.p1 gnl/MRDRNA2_/MRDRNA2_31568_c0~~gnl/MRDRNA2_/MRDRNA2_31568_c0_seq1.p1  ORF type:complete len:532 (+),score=146.39 gnl/MRDRNA2_/MRDRNA2_31568_c0_seq1:194-1789(+)